MTISRPRRASWPLLLATLPVALLVACTGGDADPGSTGAPTAAPTISPEVEEPGATEEDFAPDLESDATIGQPVEGGRFELVVDDFNCDSPQAEAAADQPTRACRLTVSARNDTDIEQPVDTASTLLLDEAATEYAPIEAQGDEDAMAALPPGETVTVVLVYDVPESAIIVAARVRDDPADEGQLVDLVAG